MSRENVEAIEGIRRLWQAFNRRDWDGFYAELDPEVEYTPVEENVVYRGRAGLTEYLGHWLDAWDTFGAEPEEIEITPTDDQAFVAIRFRGTGWGSGVEVNDPLFWAADLRDGRLHRIKEYTGRQEALEALGLPE